MTTSTRPTDATRLYRPPVKPILVDVPRYRFAMVDGSGAPASPVFQQAVSALYSLTYPVVMTLRRRGRTDAKVWPLEALWWADDFAVFEPETADRDAWQWTAMIRQPDDVPDDIVSEAYERAGRKLATATLDRVRLTAWEEGRCAQVMHRGPYAAEGPTVAALHAFIREQGLRPRGHHHEIYLSDPRRCAPAKLRTILRQPVGQPA